MKISADFGLGKSLTLWKKSKRLKKNITALYMPLRTNTPNLANVMTFYLSPIINPKRFSDEVHSMALTLKSIDVSLFIR